VYAHAPFQFGFYEIKCSDYYFFCLLYLDDRFYAAAKSLVKRGSTEAGLPDFLANFDRPP
jgi:hypothetical protein